MKNNIFGIIGLLVSTILLGIVIIFHTFEISNLREEIRALEVSNVKYTEITRKLIDINSHILQRENK